jgi:hypothetical protein
MSQDIRITSRGPIAAAPVRDFIANALTHAALADKVAQIVREYLTCSDRDPDVLANPLKRMLHEILDRAATEQDWQAVCERVVVDACDALADRHGGDDSTPCRHGPFLAPVAA